MTQSLDRLAHPVSAVRRLCNEVAHVRTICDTSTRRAYWRAIVSQAIDILRLGSLSPADAAMRGHTCTFFIGGDRVALEGVDFGLAREIYGRHSYLADGLEIRPGDIVVDLGANSGVFSLLAAVHGARVIAVEAQSKELTRLQRTLELNPSYAHAVTPVHGLVGAEAGLLSMWGPSDFSGNVPPPIKVDELLAGFGLERIDFLKVDIEGAEFALVTGESNWLDATRCIAMEVHGRFGNSSELIDVLSRRNFRIHLRDPDGRQIESVGKAGYLYAAALSDGCAGADRGPP